MEFILKNKKLFAFAFWVWVIIILYFSLTPYSPKMSIDIDKQTYRLDYFLHFMVYFSLAILYLLWKANNYFKVKPVLIIYFLFAALFLSGLIEYIQTFIPGRSFNPNDFYSNASGIIIGIITPKLIIKKNPA